MSLSKRFLSLAAIAAVSTFSFVGFARAGDDAPMAPATEASKPAAETTKTDADAPKTPCAAKVLRSAWMPAPPPESDPAMVSVSREGIRGAV